MPADPAPIGWRGLTLPAVGAEEIDEAFAGNFPIYFGYRASGGRCLSAFAQNAAVTLEQTETTYVLANGIVTARVDKRSGDLVSLRYHSQEMLGAGSGHPYGYWSHTPTRGAKVTQTITVDPAQNGGERAEVSVKGIYQGTALGQGPGGSVAADIEIRYALERGGVGPVYVFNF